MTIPQMAFPAYFSRILLFIILILFPLSATAQSYRNVSLGSSLVADDRNSSWMSPSGEFAFGFQQIVPGGGYFLAIWFDKIPEKTMVWSANRDNPVEEGSSIHLFENGRLELDNPRGQLIWAANFVRSGTVAYGAMLDSGSFVLAQNTSAVVWQSFDEPTDTMLPGQVFDQDDRLISSFCETNHSRGRFRFILTGDGKLELQSSDFPMDNDMVYAYWSAEIADIGFRLIFNQSGYIFLEATNGTVLYNLSSNVASTSQFYQRAILEYDGVLRHYVYPKTSNATVGRSMGWSVLQSLPSNMCNSVLDQFGSRVCGFNSFCSMGNDQMRRPICGCPRGYSPRDSNVRMSGCKPDFIPHNCDRQSQESELFGFSEVANVDFWRGDYLGYRSVEEEWCRQACLDDCFCAAVVYESRNCWKKRYPLPSARVDVNFRGKSLIKIRKNYTTTQPSSNNPKSNKSNRSTLIITLSVLLGISMFFLLFTSVSLFTSPSKGRKSNKLQPHSDFPGVNLRIFSFNELQEATNGFKDELGGGAFSTVYKGTLNNENGTAVAVKKLNKIATEAEKEFKAEVSTISRTNHKNLVRLLGYCDEEQHRLLVYEFMSNGSLASFLFQNSTPNWHTRVQIIFAIARGLCYLHEECSTQIIHCDIKPQNVLLDESFKAKISDFGLAKLLRPGQTRTTTGIRGTRGYVSPEWFRNMAITVKVDVYSFGILLLELICCRRNVERDVEDENAVILADWAHDCYREGALKLLAAFDADAMNDIKRFKKFVMIAIWCIQEDPSLRPNMKKVLHMLEGAVEVPMPPDPNSFID